MKVKQVVRPNYTVHPHYIIPQPTIVYGGQYPMDPYGFMPTGFGHPHIPASFTKSYKDGNGHHHHHHFHPWGVGVHHFHHHHHYHNGGSVHHIHPAVGIVVPHCPSYSMWKTGYFWDHIKSNAVRARYAYARDKCNKTRYSLKEKYKCFRINWVQYKPYGQNDIDTIRKRVQKECGELFADNFIKRQECFDDHIKNYSHRLLAQVSDKLENDREGFIKLKLSQQRRRGVQPTTSLAQSSNKAKASTSAEYYYDVPEVKVLHLA
jgi:hypothetical protein